MYVFLGIETPSAEALKGSKKFQNLRRDMVEQVRVIQEAGLWVLAGFIVGFDSDDETIFDRQLAFIDRTAIAWAMAGVLQAPPTTALFDRMKKEGRLIENSEAITNFSAPNFRTVLPLPVLLRGLSRLLANLYEAEPFFDRALRSLEIWRPRKTQKPPDLPMWYNLRLLFASVCDTGLAFQLPERLLAFPLETDIQVVARTGQIVAGLHGASLGTPLPDLFPPSGPGTCGGSGFVVRQGTESRSAGFVYYHQLDS